MEFQVLAKQINQVLSTIAQRIKRSQIVNRKRALFSSHRVYSQLSVGYSFPPTTCVYRRFLRVHQSPTSERRPGQLAETQPHDVKA
jgi:hypothetical protein